MSPPIDPRFLALVVHDLRNPLNVIGLSLRMIEDTAPQDDPELTEDFAILRENLGQMERMLNCLSDYCRQLEGKAAHGPARFAPGRLLPELVEEHRFRQGPKADPIAVTIAPDCPPEVELDPQQVRLALMYALSNSTAAANGKPVRATARGGPDRWITEIQVDAPPGEAVRAMDLRPDQVERLSGTAAERRGLELAIVAGVCQQLGGTGRLEVEPGRCSRLVLDWPVRAGGPT